MTEQFLIGTYTKKDSKGVYKVTLDPQKEEITKVELAIPSQKPAYLQTSGFMLLSKLMIKAVLHHTPLRMTMLRC